MKIKKCPFCGYKMDYDNVLFMSEEAEYCGCCPNCSASGPTKDTRREAAQAWNKRYSKQSLKIVLDK